MTTEPMFDVQPTTLAIAPAEEELSADRRRTLRQRSDVARGVHPLTRRRVHEDAARTCGTCVFRQHLHGGARSYPKCTYPVVEVGSGQMPRATSSAASDVRAWWPACSDHRPREAGE